MNQKERDADIIIIGTGGAGMMAAIAAADAGAMVLQLDKMPRIGGCFAYLGGTTAGAGTRMQKEAGIADSGDKYYEECLRMPEARERCDPVILRDFCAEAGKWIDWLDEHGAYSGASRQVRNGIWGEGWTVPRAYMVTRPFLEVIGPEYRRRLDSGHIRLLLNTRVTGLLREGGRVIGVSAVREEKAVEYRAGAVVVATGGYGSSTELVRAYNLPGAESIMSLVPAFATGDGLRMCAEAGAKLVNLRPSVPSIGGVPNPENPRRRIAHVDMKQYPGAIWVDLEGRRVVNEDAGHLSPASRQALARAPRMVLVVILDRRIREENHCILGGWFGNQPRRWEWFDEQAEKGEIIKKADNLEELALKCGIPAAALKPTMERYNAFVSAGCDADFGRRDLKYCLENPPFYAIRTGPYTMSTTGGPAIDPGTRVLDCEGKAIPGLYAVGEVAGYQGVGTGYFDMGCLIFGTRAGRNAAAEVGRKRP
jgi:fumarate reductase flavoprotein subunit